MQCGADAVAFTVDAQQRLQPGVDLRITAQGSCVLASSSGDNKAKQAKVGLEAD